MSVAMVRPLAVLVSVSVVAAQHYCISPYCDEKHGMVGKYTMAASHPEKCYEWFFKYLNNVVPGSQNSGLGYRNTTSVQGQPVTETYDSSSHDFLAAESNECGLTLSSDMNGTRPMTPEEQQLVDQGLRLPTGQMHQCACARQGRAHIIKASQTASQLQSSPTESPEIPPMSEDELTWMMAGGMNGIFGLHTVTCAFHSSGPCLLEQIEEGIARVWGGNFSQGYHPLMDNNLMLWTPTLGPLLDQFQTDGIEFFPMRWLAPTEDGPQQMYSVLASPCGKVLYEVASSDAGGRPEEHFHSMTMSRAVLQKWNEPGDLALVPMRVSRAVPPSLLDRMLEFYGATGSTDAQSLGFRTTVLLDQMGADGSRAVTLMLSSIATVHLQIWAVPEADHPEPWQPGPQSYKGDFEEARDINQVTGESLESAAEFCRKGDWSVDLYTWYARQVHEATMVKIPSNTSTLNPPYGNPLNIFLDDHISWDCVSEECELAAGSRALYNLGSRISFDLMDKPGVQKSWWPYTHDPSGFGVELHWEHHVDGFEPTGKPPAACFDASADGTCWGAVPMAGIVTV